MFVIDFCPDPFAEETAAGLQLNSVGPAHQRVGNQDLGAAL